MTTFQLSCMVNMTTFLFFIVRMPNVRGNIPLSLFYGIVMSESFVLEDHLPQLYFFMKSKVEIGGKL